jgi:hypothetical protein
VRRLPLYSLGAFVLIAVMVAVLAALTYHPANNDPNIRFDGPNWLDAQFRGDSGWYYDIAKHNYFYTPGQQSSVAFFPAYPLLVHVLGVVTGGDFATAAGLVTLACGAGFVMLFADWIRSRVEPRAAVVAVAMVLVYPYSFFLYGSGYGDASFLLIALGAFVLLERRHYVLAGLVGALATAGRPVGLAVAVGLVGRGAELIVADRAARRDVLVLVTSAVGAGSSSSLEYAESPVTSSAPVVTRPPSFRKLVGAVRFARWREATLLLSLAGLVAWMVYLGVRFHDPLAFATVQGAPGWSQEPGPHTWFKVLFFKNLFHPIPYTGLVVPQAFFCLVALLLIRAAWRRFGWGYTAYAVVSLAIPIIGTKDFMGCGRYVLAAFPLLAAGAGFLTDTGRPRWLAPAMMALLFLGLCILTVEYVHGVEVS